MAASVPASATALVALSAPAGAEADSAPAVTAGPVAGPAVADPGPAAGPSADPVPDPVATDLAPAGPPTAGPVSVRAGPGDGHRAPGVPECDRDRGHPGADSGLPARDRAPHDQGAGCAASGPAAVTERGLPPIPGHTAAHIPRRAAPTPVELSVLRV